MTLPLVSLENVDVALDGKTILRNVTWQLARHQNWAVQGGNGAGKSTFLRLLRGELGPAPGSGRRIYALDGASQTTAVGVAQAMPMVSPEVQARCLQMDWCRTVQQLVESGFGGGDYAYVPPTKAQQQLAWRLAGQVGIRSLWRRNIQQISTGELRRALIARALAGRPRVLVCDEVCDGLDAPARCALLKLLDGLARSGTQLLLTTHREEELVQAMTHRLTLENGSIVAAGVRSSVPPAPRLMTPVQRPSPTVNPTGARTRTRMAPAGSLIRIRNASVFLGRKAALRIIHWEWNPGQHWALLGPNGSGKSTLLKLITGDVHPAVGARIDRFNLKPSNTLWELRRRIGFVSPEFQAGYRENLTGTEVIASGFSSSIGLMEQPTREQLRRARAIAKRLGLGPLAGRNTLETSYGEFRKILLARALVHGPEVLALDEPFDGLDAGARQDMMAVLERLAGEGTSLIVVTHHEADLPPCITHVARLAAGRIVQQGPWQPAPHRP